MPVLRFIKSLPGHIFGIIGRLAFAGLPFLFGWIFYEAATLQCLRFRYGARSCLEDEPVVFWFFLAIIAAVAIGYVVAAIVLFRSYLVDRRERALRDRPEH